MVVVWLAVVSSADGLNTVALWRGCRRASVSAWGPFWPPVPRPRLRPPRPPGGDGVGFPLRGGVWAEEDRIGVFGGEQQGGGVRSEPGEARTI